MAEQSHSLRDLPGRALPGNARKSTSPAGEDTYRKLIYFMPTALVQVDSRAAGAAFDQLRAAGVRDIASYLETHPELVETANDTVLVTDVNREAVSLFNGRNQADLIRPVRYLFAGTPEMARRVMIAHFEGRRNYTEAAKIITFDGQVRDVIFALTYPTPPEQQDITFITISDITERLRTEAQLWQLQADYAHAARISTLGELTTSIAHEVKQPLAAIVTNGETALRWLARDDFDVAKIKQLTSRIVESAYHASDIVQRIRSMALRAAPEKAALDLKAVTTEAITFLRHDIEARKVTLAINMPQVLPRIIGDRIQLQQVIVNLLLNSIQAIDQAGNNERRIAISVSLLAGNRLAFTVHDSGPGISDANLERLFDSFFTTKDGGMGIGLAICRSIVIAHGGEISAANHPAGGAQFRLELPIAPIEHFVVR